MDTEKANKALRAAMRKMTMQRAVNTMRDVLKKLEEFECTPEDIKGMTWSKARWEAKGGREDHEHEDWIEAEADKLVADILRFKLGIRDQKHGRLPRWRWRS
jgi:hypothetical protein